MTTKIDLNPPPFVERDRAYHDEIADTYDSTIVAPRSVTNDNVYRLASRQIFPLLERLPSPIRLLDLGCGTGHLTSRFGDFFQRVTAVDHSDGMLQQAKIKFFREGRSNVELVLSESLTYLRQCPEKSFALVGCVGFLHHLSHPSIREVLFEVQRALVPGGFALLQEPIQLNGSLPPDSIQRWNGRSVVTRMRYTATLPHPEEEPLPLEHLVSWLEKAQLKVFWIHRNWEIFPHSLPPTLWDRFAIQALNVLYGRRGNVCTIIARK